MKKYNFKKGDKILIHSRPPTWSGNGKYPLHEQFPKTIIVKEIEGYSMVCTQNFGWSLKSLHEVKWELLSSLYQEEHFLGFV